jgi:hypothetical protein
VQSSVHDFSAQPSLEQADPEIYDLLQHEQTRQFKGLELIASEVRAQTHAPPTRIKHGQIHVNCATDLQQRAIANR